MCELEIFDDSLFSESHREGSSCYPFESKHLPTVSDSFCWVLSACWVSTAPGAQLLCLSKQGGGGCTFPIPPVVEVSLGAPFYCSHGCSPGYWLRFARMRGRDDLTGSLEPDALTSLDSSTDTFPDRFISCKHFVKQAGHRMSHTVPIWSSNVSTNFSAVRTVTGTRKKQVNCLLFCISGRYFSVMVFVSNWFRFSVFPFFLCAFCLGSVQ